MLDGRVLEASQVEHKPFGKPPLKREAPPYASWHLNARRLGGGHFWKRDATKLGEPDLRTQSNVMEQNNSGAKRAFGMLQVRFIHIHTDKRTPIHAHSHSGPFGPRAAMWCQDSSRNFPAQTFSTLSLATTGWLQFFFNSKQLVGCEVFTSNGW